MVEIPKSSGYRRGTVEDIDAVADLHFHSFPDVRSRAERARQFADGLYGGVESIRVLERDRNLVASMRLYSMQQWVHGHKLPVLGVASVAVAPEHRRHGYAREMMRYALREGYGRGDVASLLYPFRPSFYRNMGYALAGTVHQFEVRPDFLPLFSERERVRRARPGDVSAMTACYNAFAEATNGQLARSEQQISRIIGPELGATFVCESETGEIEGYLVMRYGHEAEPWARKAEVVERVWTTQTAYRGILGFLASMGDQWGQVILRAHPNETLENLLSDPRPPTYRHVKNLWFPVARQLKGTMFRILNVVEALKRRRWGPANVSFTLTVEDLLLEENSGGFTVKIADGKAEVRLGAAGEDLRTNIATLSSMFVGELAPSRAASIGELKVQDPQLLPVLDLAFAGPGPWTYDVF